MIRKAIAEPANPDGITTGLVSPRLDTLTPAQRALHNRFTDAIRGVKSELVKAIYYLSRIHDLKVHRLLGYRSIAEYAQAIAGFTPHQTRKMLAMARKLPLYPQIESALQSGRVSLARAEEICTSTPPEEQGKWLEIATQMPLRELRDQMAQARLESGDGAPAAPGKPVREHDRHPDGEDLFSHEQRDPRETAADATSSSAPTAHSAGIPPSPAQAAASDREVVQKPTLAPQPAVGGVEFPIPSSTEAKTYVTLSLSGEQQARWTALRQRITAMGEWSREDAVLEGLAMLINAPSAASSSPARVPRSGAPYLVVILACPDCRKATVVHDRGESIAARRLLLAAECDAVVEAPDTKRTATIPPRVRREALRRARYRCEAANCQRTQFLEIHHRLPRAQGGTNESENLLVLCWRCHQALHDNDLAARDALRLAPS